MHSQADGMSYFLPLCLCVLVVSAGSSFWGPGPVQEESAQRRSTDPGAAEGSGPGASALLAGRPSSQHPGKQHLHRQTAGPGSPCTSTLLQLGHEGSRTQHFHALLTVQL